MIGWKAFDSRLSFEPTAALAFLSAVLSAAALLPAGRLLARGDVRKWHERRARGG